MFFVVTTVESVQWDDGSKTRNFFRDVLADCDGKHPDHHPLSSKLQEGFRPARFLPGLDWLAFQLEYKQMFAGVWSAVCHQIPS